MTVTIERPAGCLTPVALEEVVSDPDRIRDLARVSGPYFMPARYLIDGAAADAAGDGTAKRREVPSYLIGPVWRGNWCMGGKELVPGTADLLTHEGFTSAAREIFAAEVVVPEQVFVNLTSPMKGSSFSHTDVPEFVGVDRSNAPGWLLLAMGASGLFEAERIAIVTAVSWFHKGERGFFRYWPEGRDAESVRHEDMWNTAVVGDNDFMHHQVERVGPRELGPPEGMTIDTTLDHDGERWRVLEAGETLATYDEEQVRLSLSWKAKVFATEAHREAVARGEGAVDTATALDRLASVMDEPLAESGPDALSSDALRDQLSTRFSTYRAG